MRRICLSLSASTSISASAAMELTALRSSSIGVGISLLPVVGFLLLVLPAFFVVVTIDLRSLRLWLWRMATALTVDVSRLVSRVWRIVGIVEIYFPTTLVAHVHRRHHGGVSTLALVAIVLGHCRCSLS